MPPAPPSPARIALALAGLLVVGASIWVAFLYPYTIWPWLLLLVAVGLSVASRRVK
ncbi:MAG: hypothetical protein OHK0015_33900 [Chloroflexi bacterium OHK40]